MSTVVAIGTAAPLYGLAEGDLALRVLREGIPFTRKGREILLDLSDLPLFLSPVAGDRRDPHRAGGPLAERRRYEAETGAALLDVAYRLLAISAETLRAEDRRAPLVEQRAIVCWAGRLLRLNASAIGRAIGRDHTSVIHLLKKGEASDAVREHATLLAYETRAHVARLGEARRALRDEGGIARVR